MNKNQFFMTTVTSVFLTFFSSYSLAAKNKNLDVYKEFNKKVAHLEKTVALEKDKTKRYELFLKSYLELSELRANNPRQSEEKELRMSMYMDSLSFLPEKKDYQANKCVEYQNKVTTMMKTYDPDHKEPYVKKAFDLVELLCR